MTDTASTPAEIEARIARRREQLATTLDEIAVRVHPKTLVGDARARVTETVDSAVGRAGERVGQVAKAVRAQFVDPKGRLRKDRVVPVVVAAAAVGLLLASRSGRGARAARRGGGARANGS